MSTHDTVVQEERQARARHRALEKAHKVQARQREKEAVAARKTRLRELRASEKSLDHDYRAAYREAKRFGRAARWTPEEANAWKRVERVGGQLRGVIAARRRIEKEAG